MEIDSESGLRVGSDNEETQLLGETIVMFML